MSLCLGIHERGRRKRISPGSEQIIPVLYYGATLVPRPSHLTALKESSPSTVGLEDPSLDVIFAGLAVQSFLDYMDCLTPLEDFASPGIVLSQHGH